MSDKVFTEGLYFNEKHENAPDFILGGLSINRNKLIPWLENQPENKAGYIKIQIKRSKPTTEKPEGNIYCELDTWEPDFRKEAAPAAQDSQQFDDESIPF